MTTATAAVRAESFTTFSKRIGAYRHATPGGDHETLAVMNTRDAVLDHAVAAYWHRRFPTHRHGAFFVSPARPAVATRSTK